MTTQPNMYQLDAMASAGSMSAADYAAHLRAEADMAVMDEWGDLDARGLPIRRCGWMGEGCGECAICTEGKR